LNTSQYACIHHVHFFFGFDNGQINFRLSRFVYRFVVFRPVFSSDTRPRVHETYPIFNLNVQFPTFNDRSGNVRAVTSCCTKKSITVSFSKDTRHRVINELSTTPSSCAIVLDRSDRPALRNVTYTSIVYVRVSYRRQRPPRRTSAKKKNVSLSHRANPLCVVRFLSFFFFFPPARRIFNIYCATYRTVWRPRAGGIGASERIKIVISVSFSIRPRVCVRAYVRETAATIKLYVAYTRSSKTKYNYYDRTMR